MIYLMLNVACGAIIATIFKINGSKDVNKYAVITANYCVALAFSLIVSLYKGKFALLNSNSMQMFFYEMKSVFAGNKIFSVEASAIWAMIIGCPLGYSYCLSFLKYQKTITENGMGISNMFMRISVIIPMIISIILWKEYPTAIQFLGILLCFASIVLFNVDFKSSKKIMINADLLLLLLFGGISQFSAKLYQKFAVVECKEVLTFFIFLAALIASIVFLIKGKNKISRNDYMAGIAIGIPNVLSTIFLILALNCMNTSIVYVLSSVSSIIIVMLIGLLFFKENIGRKDIVGIITTVIAVVLINI